MLINISYEDFSYVHSLLKKEMNVFFDSAISHMDSVLSSASNEIDDGIISKYKDIRNSIDECYSSDIPAISEAFDDFIYRMSKIDDYFAMYNSSNAMGELTDLYNEFIENDVYDNGESLDAFASSIEKFYFELVSMGFIYGYDPDVYTFNDSSGNSKTYHMGIERFKEDGNLEHITGVYSQIVGHYNNLYLNGLYNYYHDDDKDDSILFGEQSIEELYNDACVLVSEVTNNSYDYWKWENGFLIDQTLLSNEYNRFLYLNNNYNSLSEEEREEFNNYSEEYKDYYYNKLDEISMNQNYLVDQLGIDIPGTFIKLFFIEAPICIATSFASGVLHVAENVIDGAITLWSGELGWLFTPLSPVFNYVIDYYLRENEDYQKWVVDFVGTNWTKEGYFELMELCGFDSDIASQAYQVGAPIGTMGGYLFLGTITGGAGLLVDLGVSALAGAGDAAETAFQNGATFDQGYWSSVIAGALSIGAELSLGSISKLPASPALYNRVLSEVGGAAFAASEPFLSSLSQYFLYASNQVDENGNLMYTDFNDYMNKTGGWAAVGLAGAIGAGSVHIGQANAADNQIYTEFQIREKLRARGIDTSFMPWEDVQKNYAHVIHERVEPWKTVKTEDVEAKILKDYNSKQVDPSKQYKKFSDLKAAHPDEVKLLTYENYKQSVVSEKTGGKWGHDEAVKKAKTDKAKFNTEMNGKDWDDLSYSERQQILAGTTVSEEEISAAMAANVKYAEQLADANIKHIEELCANGKVKNKYSPDDLVRMIRDDVSQKTILTDEAIKEIYSKLPVDENGKTKVVLFQNGEGKNFTQFSGMVGAPDGAYVMPLADANDVINKCTVGGKINTDLLTKKLGGVEFGENVIMITVDVDVKDLDLANGALSTAYPGDWTYGCKTFGVDGEGVSEFIIPPHYFKEDSVNIVVISGNKSIEQFIEEIV